MELLQKWNLRKNEQKMKEKLPFVNLKFGPFAIVC